MPKLTLFTIAFVVIILTGVATLYLNKDWRSAPKSEVDAAVNQAKLLYREEKERGKDLSNGPCLSNALMPDWVLDIVHNPRLPIDDLPENQCSAYREGGAKHLVELDTEGNLVRAK